MALNTSSTVHYYNNGCSGNLGATLKCSMKNPTTEYFPVKEGSE